MASKQYNKSKQPPLLPRKRQRDSEIKDNKSLIYWIAMLLGCGILTAYNFLVSAPDYFSQEYPNYPNLNMLIVPAYTIPDILFLILTVLYGHLFSFTSRIVICFTLMGLFMLFPIFTQYIVTSENIAFYIILSVSGMCGVTTAVLQTAIVGFCNYLPVNYIQVSISGQSVAGIIAGGLRIGINMIQTYTCMSADTNGMIYFASGAVIDILCGVAFLCAIRSAFVKFHLSEYFWTRKYRGIHHSEQGSAISGDLLQRTETQTILRRLVDDSIPTPTADDFKSVTFPNAISNTERQVIGGNITQTTKKKRKRTTKERKLAASIETQQRTYMKHRETTHEDESDDIESNMTTDDEFEEAQIEVTRSVGSTTIQSGTKSTKMIISIDAPVPILEDNMEQNVLKNVKVDKQEQVILDKVTYCGVFSKIKVLAISIFLVFFVTFLVFPGMVTSLESEYKWVNDKHFMPVFLVMEFNVFDYIGRQFLAAYTSFSFSKKTIWIGCFWRILIYPLFIAMYKGIIKNDMVAYGAMAILALTNGHFCCLLFMWAPALVTSKEQQLCGSIMSFGLVMGITLGSNITLLLSTIGVL